MSEPTVRGGAASKAEKDPFRLGWRYVWRPGPGGLMEQVQVPLTPEDVLHPQEGDFIVTNEAHRRDCAYLDGALQLALNGQPGIKVFADHRVDWQVEGIRPHGPDIAVFEGVDREWSPYEGTFPVADFGARPVLVIEVTSPSTRDNDLDTKVLHYHRAGIPFYLIIDHLPERTEDGRPIIGLIGYRTTPEGYVRVPVNAEGRVPLPIAGLSVGVREDRPVVFYADGTRVPEIRELNRELKQATQKLEEAQELTAEAIAARQKAERDKQQAERDAQKEADLRKQVEDRLALMEAEMKRLRGEP